MKAAEKAYAEHVHAYYCFRLEVNMLKLKFKADYFLAATETNDAAQAYQLAKMKPESKAAYIRAAELRLKDHDHQSAARCYDNAGEFEKAADCYMICGGIDQAVRSIMRRAVSDPSVQVKCFEKAIDLYSKDEGKDVLASDIFKQYIPKLLLAGNFEKYYEVSDRYKDLLTRLEQWPFVHKEILSQVIVRLSLGEIVGAERILSGSNLNVTGFVHSPEYAAADDLLIAVRENDAEALKNVVSRPTVTYVNTEVVKIARNIKTVHVEKQASPQEAIDAMLL